MRSSTWWPAVVLGVVTALLATGCIQYALYLDFNEDGSGLARIETTVDLMELQADPWRRPTEEDCAAFADDLGPNPYATASGTQRRSELRPDGLCDVSVTMPFTSPDHLDLEEYVTFHETAVGWEAVMYTSDDDWTDGIVDATTIGRFMRTLVTSDELTGDGENSATDLLESDEFSAYADVSLLISMRLPGVSSDDHNAHRVEDCRFVWEYSGTGFQTFLSEFRATSTSGGTCTSSSQGNTWIALVVIGVIFVLGATYVVQERREQALNANPPDAEPDALSDEAV